MAVRTSTTSGDWETGATWVGGVAPTIADSAVIAIGHTVTVTTSDAMDTPRVLATTVNKGGYLNIQNKQFILSGDFTLGTGTDYFTDPGGKVSLKGGKILFHQSSNRQYNFVWGQFCIWDIGMGSDASVVNESPMAETTVLGITDANIASGYQADSPTHGQTNSAKGYFRNVRFEYHWQSIVSFRICSKLNNKNEYLIPYFGNITLYKYGTNSFSLCNIEVPDSVARPYIHFNSPFVNNAQGSTTVRWKNFIFTDTSGGGNNLGYYINGGVALNCKFTIGDRTASNAVGLFQASTLDEETEVIVPSTNSVYSAPTFSLALFRSCNILNIDFDIYSTADGAIFSNCLFSSSGTIKIYINRGALTYLVAPFYANVLQEFSNLTFDFNMVCSSWTSTQGLFDSGATYSNKTRVSRKTYFKDLILRGTLPPNIAGGSTYDSQNSPVEYLLLPAEDGNTGGIYWYPRVNTDFRDEREADGAIDPWDIGAAAYFSSTKFDMVDCANGIVSLLSYTPRSILSVTAVTIVSTGCTVEVSVNGSAFATASTLANWVANYAGNGSDVIILRVTKTSGGAGTAASLTSISILTTVSHYDFDASRGLTTGQAVIENKIDENQENVLSTISAIGINRVKSLLNSISKDLDYLKLLIIKRSKKG